MIDETRAVNITRISSSRRDVGLSKLLSARTLKIFAILLIAYGLLAIPAYWGPAFLEPISSYVVIVPLFSIYAFHKLGIPGLLEHNGACGWGLCGPTALGWVFLVIFWTGVTWVIAWGLARLTAGSRTDAP